MLLLAAMLLQTTPIPAAARLGDLEGCWDAAGQVRGQASRNVLRASRRLDGRYLLLELHRTDGRVAYDAAVVMGESGNGRITAYWMDTFGPAFSVEGAGAIGQDGGIEVLYRYPDAVYVNRLRRDAEGWRWTIDESKPGTIRPFASYLLRRGHCGETRFGFDLKAP